MSKNKKAGSLRLRLGQVLVQVGMAQAPGLASPQQRDLSLCDLIAEARRDPVIPELRL